MQMLQNAMQAGMVRAGHRQGNTAISPEDRAVNLLKGGAEMGSLFGLL